MHSDPWRISLAGIDSSRGYNFKASVLTCFSGKFWVLRTIPRKKVRYSIYPNSSQWNTIFIQHPALNPNERLYRDSCCTLAIGMSPCHSNTGAIIHKAHRRPVSVVNDGPRGNRNAKGALEWKRYDVDDVASNSRCGIKCPGGNPGSGLVQLSLP